MATKIKRTGLLDADELEIDATRIRRANCNAESERIKMSSSAEVTKDDAYFRNLYAADTDFGLLGKQASDLGKMKVLELNQREGYLDFKDPAAVKQLTKTLLKLHFGLEIRLPDDRLCPPVPNRHNYILWLKELTDSTSYLPPGRRLTGLDIGTGASCVYPLLGTVQRDWHFIATEIDSKSLAYATTNVLLNDLDDRIRIVRRRQDAPLIPFDAIPQQTLDFTMMNPPFYTSEEDLIHSARKKDEAPHSACTGAPVEMVCEGGEVAHVSRLLEESLVLRERVQWYTSMLGKADSVKALVEKLRQHAIDNYAIAEFVQGKKTRRWGIGWSFGPMRPSEKAARTLGERFWKEKKYLPTRTQTELLTLSKGMDVAPLVRCVREATEGLELMLWEWDVQNLKGVGRARENVWSRAWRRRRKVPAAGKETFKRNAEAEVCRFGFIVSVQVDMAGSAVSLRWVEGGEPALFESFAGYLQRKLKELPTTRLVEHMNKLD